MLFRKLLLQEYNPLAMFFGKKLAIVFHYLRYHVNYYYQFDKYSTTKIKTINGNKRIRNQSFDRV